MPVASVTGYSGAAVAIDIQSRGVVAGYPDGTLLDTTMPMDDANPINPRLQMPIGGSFSWG